MDNTMKVMPLLCSTGSPSGPDHRTVGELAKPITVARAIQVTEWEVPARGVSREDGLTSTSRAACGTTYQESKLPY